MAVYRNCIISTLLNGSGFSTTVRSSVETPERFLPAMPLHLLAGACYPQRRLGGSRQPFMYTFLRQRRLDRRWVGHVRRMNEGRNPKKFLYGELLQGQRTVGPPKLRKWPRADMLAIGPLPTHSWETLARDRTAWKGNDKMNRSLARMIKAT